MAKATVTAKTLEWHREMLEGFAAVGKALEAGDLQFWHVGGPCGGFEIPVHSYAVDFAAKTIKLCNPAVAGTGRNEHGVPYHDFTAENCRRLGWKMLPLPVSPQNN